jgi:HJR/Mrr/RecB family endonuclease
MSAKNVLRLAQLMEPTEVQIYLLYSILEERFKEYHLAKLSHPVTITDIGGLSGPEFETYVGRILTKCGYRVSGTPATGDQGADLIAERDGRKIIIQAKRYDDTVGNKAVQEVLGALSFYGGDEGWVVTNSTFTPSAKALAQKANVKLIDGAGLADMEELSQQERSKQ